MSNLRWILLFSGFAILFLLYFSGRPRKSNTNQSRGPEQNPEQDLATVGNVSNTGYEDSPGQTNTAPGLAHEPEAYSQDGYGADPYSGQPNYQGEYAGQNPVQTHAAHDYAHDGYSHDGYGPAGYPEGQYPGNTYAGNAYAEAQPATEPSGVQPPPVQTQTVSQVDQYSVEAAPELNTSSDYYEAAEHTQLQSHIARPSSTHHGVPPIPPSVPSEGFSVTDGFGPIDPADLDRPAASGEDFISSRDELQSEGSAREDQGKGFSNPISQKIAAFSDKLSIRRNNRAAQKAIKQSSPRPADSNQDKIVLLHVMAPNNGIIEGSLLLEVIESRGYHYGDLDIFHSLHEGKTVFSIAKVVEPGRFDINDITSFDTPGLALILRLPGPVQGDVAFEVMMSEAHELASALGCRVLDSGRSTLSRQTVSHLRESILEYMHREKYLSKAIS